MLRDNVISAYRSTKGLDLTKLCITGPTSTIYINEHLTINNKLLFRQTREMAKKQAFRYVWLLHLSSRITSLKDYSLFCNTLYITLKMFLKYEFKSRLLTCGTLLQLDLGITLDSKLHLDLHVDNIINKAFKIPKDLLHSDMRRRSLLTLHHQLMQTKRSVCSRGRYTPITPKDLKEFTVIEEGTKKKYRCNKCEHVMLTLVNMRKHVSAHIDKFYCDACKRNFKNQTKLRKHMQTHQLYDCPECSQQFTKIKLLRHRAEKHGVELPTCNICGYKTIKQSLLVNHQRRVHMNERTIPCPHCDMKFFLLCDLRHHMVRHDPIKKYECKFCKKNYPRLETLKRHERIHTGDKRKVCTLCGERFVQKASLNYHMLKRHPESV
ncbi:hypothetical protein ABMA27_012802 [Loxostege sticticalis]|uniref:C2H2-type domain-containing protein n=1 Tax=Loxostege sticticalis TaxID=481309 RepID=A0ABR3GZU8_LOXSC